MSGKHYEIREGDCLEVLRDLPDACFDSVVTDPPYALSFMGKGWDKVLPPSEVWAECLRVAKPGAMLLAFGGTRTYHRLTCAIEDAGWEVRDCLSWLYGSGFPKSLDVSRAIDKAAGAEREVLGTRSSYRPKANETRDPKGFQDRSDGAITAPATDAARLWRGWGTALKPAWEPIVLAMKPLDGTFAANALAHGVAGLNVDGCRIESPEGRPLIEMDRRKMEGSAVYEGARDGSTTGSKAAGTTTAGRWPANLVLDEEAARMLDEMSGNRPGAVSNGSRTQKGHCESDTFKIHAREQKPGYADQGGASRFFYCAKASKKDRTMEGRVENKHPTVKPVELMRWLVRLVSTPTGGAVLDPFAGSGSTGVACALEGRDFLGIELEAESASTARARIEAAREDAKGKACES